MDVNQSINVVPFNVSFLGLYTASRAFMPSFEAFNTVRMWYSANTSCNFAGIMVIVTYHLLNAALNFGKRGKSHGNSWSLSLFSWMSWHLWIRSSFCSSINRLDMNLAAICSTFRLSFKMLWTEPTQFSPCQQFHG